MSPSSVKRKDCRLLGFGDRIGVADGGIGAAIGGIRAGDEFVFGSRGQRDFADRVDF